MVTRGITLSIRWDEETLGWVIFCVSPYVHYPIQRAREEYAICGGILPLSFPVRITSHLRRRNLKAFIEARDCELR